MKTKFLHLSWLVLCTLLITGPGHLIEAQELRLSSTAVQENQPPETLVGRFYSDSFDAVHYLPGVHDLAISRDYLYYIADGGDLWVVKIVAEGEADTPIRLVERGVKSITAGTTKVYYAMEDGSLWELEIFLNNILNKPTLSSKKKKLVESNVYQAFHAWEGKVITMNTEGYLSLNYPDQDFPVEGQTASSVATGFRHCIFAQEDGSLWGFGSNANEQLMLSESGSLFSTPKRLMAGGVQNVAATEGETYFTRVDGSLWGIGKGMKKFSHSRESMARIVSSGVTDLVAKDWYCVYRMEDGTAQLFATDLKYQESPAPISLGKLNAILLAAGKNAFAYTKKDGSLWYQKVDKEKPNEDWPKPVEIRHPRAIFLPSYVDNRFFRISGSKLLTKQELNHERDKPYQIYVRSVDQQGRDVRKGFSIQVIEKTKAP
jgi:hypothetical protein